MTTSSDEEEDMNGLIDSVLHDIEATDALKEAENSVSPTASTTSNGISGFHFPDTNNQSDDDMQEAAAIANSIIYESKENKYEHTPKPNHQFYTAPVSMKKKRSSSDAVTQLRQAQRTQQARTAVTAPQNGPPPSSFNAFFASASSSVPTNGAIYGGGGTTTGVAAPVYSGMTPIQSPLMFTTSHSEELTNARQFQQQIPIPFASQFPAQPSVSTPIPRAAFKKNYELDKKLAINKIIAVLMEIDEHNNGELDFEEFQEAINSIDPDQLPSESQQIYEHIAYDDRELSIDAFRDLLLLRCKEIDVQKEWDKKPQNNRHTYHHRKLPSVTPKLILRWAFPNVFTDSGNDSSSSKSLHSPSHAHAQAAPKLQSYSLKKIRDILRDKDDDANLFVDWGEFKEAMSDLGVKLSARHLQIAFTALLERQSKDEELGIEWFAKELTKVSNYREMKPNQILQQFLIAEIPQKNKYRSPNTFSWIDYGNNQPLRKKRHSRTQSSSGTARRQAPSLLNKYSLNDMDAYLPASSGCSSSSSNKRRHHHPHHHQHRKSHKRNKTVSLSSMSNFAVSAAMPNGNIRPILKPSASMNVMAGHDGSPSSSSSSSSSIMGKPNCSVVIIPVLKKHLREVDDNSDGKIDWEEFKEVLRTLHSSFEGVRASKMFYAIADISTHEMSVQRFMHAIEAMYKLYPTISGDECIEKVAAKYSPNRGGSMDASSIHSSATVLSLVSEGASNETVLYHGNGAFSSKENTTSTTTHTYTSVLEEVQHKLDAIECADDGYLSKAEFVQFLKECTIDDKFNELDIESIFYHLIDVDRSISEQLDASDSLMRASSNLLMHKVHQVHADHPNYSARKAVYRVCRRVLKTSKSPKHH